ncbi:unnamed protein product [Pneumocystis jirovecii]|uniref:HAD hydrolase, family IA n=1 Tax=Pneumocystis jirovecii TaxID=42068 RepID=L0PAS5_PNEJI|nr:unnamed protein product [Pneumocystis jirovecii]
MNSTEKFPQIKACLLIDSEQLYTEITNELLARYNKPSLSIETKIKMMGIPGLEATKILIEWSGIEVSAEQLYMEASDLQKIKFPGVKEMPGCQKLLNYLKNKKITVALATSSSIRSFKLKTDHLGHIFSHFNGRIIRGDDPRIPEGRGKPAPDIYILSLKVINEERKSKNLDPLTPQECLVFGSYSMKSSIQVSNLFLEDSIAGVKAGRSAGMRVVWVPEPVVLEYYKEEKNDIIGPNNEILFSLEDFEPRRYGL